MIRGVVGLPFLMETINNLLGNNGVISREILANI